GGGAWGIQVGAYGDKGSALRSAQKAIRHVKAFAPQASVQVVHSKGRGKRNYHLARVLDLAKGDAYEACRILKQKRFKCLVLRDRDAADVRTASTSGSRIGTPFPKPTFSTAVAANTAAPAEVGKSGSWGVQVGAFIGIDPARDAARDASANVTNHLAYGVPAVVKRTYRNKRGTRTMYLARVHGVSKESASLACRQLRNDRKDCMVLRVSDNVDIAWAPSGKEVPVVAQGSTPNSSEGSGFGAAWGVQVGVVPTKGSAEKIAAKAIATLPDPLEAGSIKVVPLAAKKGGTLYRARVVGITKPQAHDACRALKTRKIPCMVLRMEDPDAA
ncbi:MAG: SPOR domain-containing protein, partial [Rhodospirillales bacterium]|nr:SPOR domain-containing protein [Rhodospirillales bacterium]